MKFENTEVFNFEGALRGMRNPMDSWNKSDSQWGLDGFEIGENDMKLMKSLVIGGSEHRKYLRQIFVSVDITAPRMWWCEYDTFKIGTTANSCSTMHTIMKKPITQDMFSVDHNDDYLTNLHWTRTLEYLNYLREVYNETKNILYFRLLKEALPESFLQKRTCTLNYENVFNMRGQRKNHKLKEWSVDFINWSDGLPYASEIFN